MKPIKFNDDLFSLTKKSVLSNLKRERLSEKINEFFTDRIDQDDKYQFLTLEILSLKKDGSLHIIKGRQYYNYGELSSAKFERFEAIILFNKNRLEIIKIYTELFPGLFIQMYPKI